SCGLASRLCHAPVRPIDLSESAAKPVHRSDEMTRQAKQQLMKRFTSGQVEICKKLLKLSRQVMPHLRTSLCTFIGR
ncbi:hypothetical protein Pgy4_43872, partial [Pseudomonas savastanoi pv. glycinea str. race 4]